MEPRWTYTYPQDDTRHESDDIVCWIGGRKAGRYTHIRWAGERSGNGLSGVRALFRTRVPRTADWRL